MNKKIIQEFIYFKKSRGEVKNQEEFGLKIGYASKSAFSQALGKSPLPEELITKINSVYPEFKEWRGNIGIINQKKESPFEELPIGEQMKIIYCQNIEIKKENIALNDKMNKILDYIDEYLRPLFDYIQDREETVKTKHSKH